jgi:hypothetical protein
MSRCYVYALTDTAVPRLRVGGRTIEAVRAGDLYAAVARMNALPAVSEETLAEQHAIVARVFARADAILPMRFGALVDTEELERFVSLHHAALAAALDLVRRREQMTVRVFGPPVPARVGAAPRTTSGTEYLRSRRDAAQPVPLPDAAATLRRSVRPLVAAERTASGEGRVRATLWHLIERGRSDSYRMAIARAARGVPSTFQVVVSGPWPPFAFAPELLP